MKFTKMQGLGNDYLYCPAGHLPSSAASLSRRLSDRHFGVGSDGMIWILPSQRADFAMRIFNADGSEANMCGNGIRCVGKYVYDKGLTQKTVLQIETLCGIKTLRLLVAGGAVQAVSVEMGAALVGAPAELALGPDRLVCIPVDMGNPHAVFFVPEPDAVQAFGPLVQKHPSFPDGVNAEFVRLTGPQRLRMRVWERGSGITMACGTGACAAASAAVAAGHCVPDIPITVELDGGCLEILVRQDFSVTMTGPAAFVFEGETDDEVE